MQTLKGTNREVLGMSAKNVEFRRFAHALGERGYFRRPRDLSKATTASRLVLARPAAVRIEFG